MTQQMKSSVNPIDIFSTSLTFSPHRVDSAQLVLLWVRLPSELCLCLLELQEPPHTLRTGHWVSMSGPVSAHQLLFGMDPRHGLAREPSVMPKK